MRFTLKATGLADIISKKLSNIMGSKAKALLLVLAGVACLSQNLVPSSRQRRQISYFSNSYIFGRISYNVIGHGVSSNYYMAYWAMNYVYWR